MALLEYEKRCLLAAAAPTDGEVPVTGEFESWTEVLLTASLEAARRARPLRLESLADELELKPNGSPVTRTEHQIECFLRQRITEFDPEAQVLGEETGGHLPSTGIGVAIDPIDGTWSLVNRTATFTITLAAFRDGEPWIGLVLHPATGEVTYAVRGQRTRLLQLSTFGESAQGMDLPLDSTGDSLLVNLHPARSNGPLVATLHEAWRAGTLQMVRSPGGSPAGALAEAAKGLFVYVNRWSPKPAAAYDLAAGTLLVEGAGGAVVDLAGNPVDPVHHRGPLLAAVDAEARERVAELVRAVLP